MSRPGTVDQPWLKGVIDELLDQLEMDRTALVGLSMGGGVETGYALSRPERPGGLVAISPGGVEAALDSSPAYKVLIKRILAQFTDDLLATDWSRS